MAYDCWLDISPYSIETPDAQFALFTKTIIFDHLNNNMFIALTPFISKSDDPEEVYQKAESDAKEIIDQIKSVKSFSQPIKKYPFQKKCNMSQQEFENAVKVAKKHIFDGDIFQAVLSRKYEVETNQTSLELYIKLREINPSPYMYLLEFDDTSLIGASPETLLTVYNRRVIVNPIAGTCPRGSTAEEDKKLADAMLLDEKECAEHVMLVDLGRNDVRMVCKPGIKLDRFKDVLKYSHLQHIESTVSGELRSECDQFDATRAIFPAGTLSGAPKIRAMEIIHELEKTARGIYGGGVGYYSWDGNADFAIVIRTIIKKGNIASIQAGAGIVADSDPTYEYNETERKMAAMLKALE
jgi:anthranilate synthase component 1